MTKLNRCRGNPLAHQCPLFVFLCVLATTHPSICQAVTFTDDFNRPDSATVGNGWSDTTENIGAGNLAIINNELTCPSESSGIFRPFPFTAPITTTARVKEQSGFGTLLRRYETRFLVRNNGTLYHGYGVVVTRSDQNFSNSTVILVEDNIQLAILPSTFQYGPEIHVSVTFNLDGSITGTVSEPAPSTNTFSFSFGPHAIQSTGDNFSIAVGCSSGPVDQRIDDVSISDSTALLLSFPLPGYTPYDVPIFSLLDHSVDPSQGNNGYYHINGTITAYDGEVASGMDGDGKSPCASREKKKTCTIIGYKKDAQGTPFALRLLGGYDDKDTSDNPDDPKNVLWYDGHPGYDYGAAAGVSITAAHGGILCVASNRTAPSGPKLLWRDPVHCPYARDVLADGAADKNSWDRWHTFYILLPNSNYSTWYLHADHLDTNITNAILQQGWAENVLQGDVVAYVGNKAPPGVKLGAHLHFEVRTNGDTPADPYGDGSFDNPLLLWDIPPP